MKEKGSLKESMKGYNTEGENWQSLEHLAYDISCYSKGFLPKGYGISAEGVQDFWFDRDFQRYLSSDLSLVQRNSKDGGNLLSLFNVIL